MIKLKDLKFDVRGVGPCEGYPDGKSGREMTAFYMLPDKVNEAVYAEHDFNTEKLTSGFKRRALHAINKKVKEFLNKNGKE